MNRYDKMAYQEYRGSIEKLEGEFQKLSDTDKYLYFEEMFGEQLGDIWRNWEEDLVEEQYYDFKDKGENQKHCLDVENLSNEAYSILIDECLKSLQNPKGKMSPITIDNIEISFEVERGE